MSKTCLNCGREISGEGKNKVFCDDCFSIMSSFLRRLPKSNEPAMTVYERTKPDFPNMGINDKAAVYLEKCCKRYDEGMMNTQPTQKTPSSAQARADEGDYPDPIPLPRRRRPAPMRDTPHASDTSYVSGLRYDINDDSVNTGRTDEDAGSTQMFSYTERTPSYEEYQYREYSEAAAKVAAEEAAREAASRTGVIKTPERMQQRRHVNEYDNNEVSTDTAGNGEDDYSYDDRSGAGSGDETKRRLYLILSAAAAAVILFAVLAFSGLLTGSRKPNTPVGGSGSDSASDDTNGGVIVLPAESDSTDAPETTAEPATTVSPTVDPATCQHQWTAATCTEASVCTICGTVNGSPLGHAFSAPTCTEHGKCMRCGEVNTADTLAAHDYAPATCTDPQKCRMCGATTGSALGHTFSEPTCSEHGKCTRCGAVNNNDKLADHDYAAATCTEPQKCKVCGATKGAPLGHDYAEATCTEPQKCKVCGATNGEPLGHDYTAAPTFEWSDDLTCTYTLVCTRDASHTAEGGAATVTHETTTAPTCSTPGVETYTATATVNGTTYMWTEKKTLKIPASGEHVFDEGSFVCSVCGEQFDGFESAQSWSGTQYRNTNLNIIVVSTNPDSFQYQLTNTGDLDSGDAIPEGAFRLIVKSGDSIKVLTPRFINAEEDRGDLFPNDKRYHEVRFDIEEGDEPLFYEYYESNFSTSHFWTSSRSAALYWKAQ